MSPRNSPNPHVHQCVRKALGAGSLEQRAVKCRGNTRGPLGRGACYLNKPLLRLIDPLLLVAVFSTRVARSRSSSSSQFTAPQMQSSSLSATFLLVLSPPTSPAHSLSFSSSLFPYISYSTILFPYISFLISHSPSLILHLSPHLHCVSSK